MEIDGRQVWIASLFDNTMHVFNVFTRNIYNLQGVYIYDSQCFHKLKDLSGNIYFIKTKKSN